MVYEMRISYWSSDVCSSDLTLGGHEGKDHGKGAVELSHNVERVRHAHGVEYGRLGRDQDEIGLARCLIGHVARDRRPVDHDKIGAGILAGFEHGGQAHRLNRRHGGRSEEHTSELQSLMRISYAVFCLKKKKQKTHIPTRKVHKSYRNHKQ